MNEALDMVWQRAELRDHVLSARELARWQADQRDVITALGLICRTSDATALLCDDCGPPHPVEVIRDPRKPQRPYYLCPEIGRVPLTPTDLYRWKADFDQIAETIKAAIGLSGKTSTLIPSRIWLLGRQRIANTYWELFLMCGLCWPDGIQLLSQCSRIQQAPAPVVLVPYRLPVAGTVAPSWPIRTLSELVSFEGSSLVVDIPTLATAAGVSGGSAALGTKPPRQRMSRSLGTPEAVQAVTQYLEHTQITDTQFGNQFQTTDKTVRKFLKSGRMRRSNFRDMASSMGLTTEQLLLGTLPSTMTRPSTR